MFTISYLKKNRLPFMATLAGGLFLILSGLHYTKYGNFTKDNSRKQVLVETTHGRVYEGGDLISTENDFTDEELPNRLEVRKQILRQQKNKIRQSRTPDVILIGARKCGTGAFQTFLLRNPLIQSSVHEVHYYDKNLNRGVQYYRSILPNVTDDELSFEKTPSYFVSEPANLPEIIKRDCPGVKILLLLCEPVARSFSDFVMRAERNFSSNCSTFEVHMNRYLPEVKNALRGLSKNTDIEMRKAQSLVKRDKQFSTYTIGLYAIYLKRWIRSFSSENLMIIDGQDFLKDPGSVIESVQKFLSVPVLIRKKDFVIKKEAGMFCMKRWWLKEKSLDETENVVCTSGHKGQTRSNKVRYELPPKTVKTLRRFYAPYNERLYKILGKRLDW